MCKIEEGAQKWLKTWKPSATWRKRSFRENWPIIQGIFVLSRRCIKKRFSSAYSPLKISYRDSTSILKSQKWSIVFQRLLKKIASSLDSCCRNSTSLWTKSTGKASRNYKKGSSEARQPFLCVLNFGQTGVGPNYLFHFIKKKFLFTLSPAEEAAAESV